MEYIFTARSLFTSDFSYSRYHGLGFPFAIRIAWLIVGDGFLAAKVVSLIAGLAFLWISLRLVEYLFGHRAAWISGLFIMSTYTFLAYSIMAMSDMLAAALGLGALFTFVRAPQKIKLYAVAGVLAGFAAATRYAYFGLFTWVAVPIVSGGGRWGLRAAGAFIFGFLLGVSPLLLQNWISYGHPLANENYRNIAATIYGWDQASRFDSLQEVVAANPFLFFLGWAKRFGFDLPVFMGHVTYWPTFLAGPGLILAVVQANGEKQRATIAFLLCSLLFAAFQTIGWLEERFFLLLIPLILGAAAYFLSEVLQKHRCLSLALLAVSLIVNLAALGDNFYEFFALFQAPEYRRAGLWIREHAPADARILVSQPQIAYYADRAFLSMGELGASGLDDLVSRVAKDGVDYVVIDRRYALYPGHYPWLKVLLQESKGPAGWKLVYEEHNTEPIVVWFTRTGDMGSR